MNPNEVMVGSTYFLLEYADDEKRIPVMDTVVFIGENLNDGDQDKLYFQDAYSYEEGFDYEVAEADEWSKCFVKLHNELDNVFTFDRVLELMRCSLRR